MTEQGNTDLEKQVRRNTRMLYLVLALLLIIVGALVLFVNGIVPLRRLVIVDDRGKVRVSLGVDDFDDASFMEFYDRKGEVKIRMALNEYEEPLLNFVSASNTIKSVLTEEWSIYGPFGPPTNESTVSSEGAPSEEP